VRCGGQQAESAGLLDGFVPAVHAELVVGVAHVGLDRVDRQVELVGGIRGRTVTQIALARSSSSRVALAGLGLLLAALGLIVAAVAQAAMGLFLAGTAVGGLLWAPSS